MLKNRLAIVSQKLQFYFRQRLIRLEPISGFIQTFQQILHDPTQILKLLYLILERERKINIRVAAKLFNMLIFACSKPRSYPGHDFDRAQTSPLLFVHQAPLAHIINTFYDHKHDIYRCFGQAIHKFVIVQERQEQTNELTLAHVEIELNRAGQTEIHDQQHVVKYRYFDFVHFGRLIRLLEVNILVFKVQLVAYFVELFEYELKLADALVEKAIVDQVQVEVEVINVVE
jgi:hypothetical protein